MTRAQSLAETLLALVPPDGSAIGNQSLLQKFIAAGTAEEHRAAEADFEWLKEELIASGVLLKGKGRGGSLRRATAEAGGFDLAVQAAPAVDGEKGRKTTVTAARRRSAPAGDNAQIISYRHADKRKNNPEVGMVKPYTDPEEAKTRWAYDPHIDPALQFGPSRAGIEHLVAIDNHRLVARQIQAVIGHCLEHAHGIGIRRLRQRWMATALLLEPSAANWRTCAASSVACADRLQA